MSLIISLRHGLQIYSRSQSVQQVWTALKKDYMQRFYVTRCISIWSGSDASPTGKENKGSDDDDPPIKINAARRRKRIISDSDEDSR